MAAQAVKPVELPRGPRVDVRAGPRGIEVWDVAGWPRPWRMVVSSYAFWTLREDARAAAPHSWRCNRAMRPVGPTSTMAARPGDVWIARRAGGPLGLRILFVAADVVERAFGALPLAPWGAQTDAPAVFEQLASLVRAVASPAAAADDCDRRLRGFLESYARASRVGSPPGRIFAAREGALRRAKPFVERSFERRDFRLDDVAHAAGRSKYHVARAFTGALGVSTWQFVKLLRCDRALALLRRGDRPDDVAAAVGFADQPHLTRVLRQEFGLTPGAFLRALGSSRSAGGGRRPDARVVDAGVSLGA